MAWSQDLTDSLGFLIWLQGFCGFYSHRPLVPNISPPCARKTPPPPAPRRPGRGRVASSPSAPGLPVLPEEFPGRGGLGVRTGVGGLLWGWGVRMGLGGPFVGLGLRTGVLGPLRGAAGEDGGPGAPLWGWACHRPQEAIRTREETWPAGDFSLSHQPHQRKGRTGSGLSLQRGPARFPSSGVVCPAAWSGGPCRPRCSEHPHCGLGTLPRPALRPSRLGAVDTRQRPCPVTSVSSPPQVPRPHTGRPSWPHSLGTTGLWLQPVTLAGPVAAGGTEGVPRACLSTSAVRGKTGVQ